jgi:hypothetical protein
MLLVLLLFAQALPLPQAPNPTLTPGALCSPLDPDFGHRAYPAKLPLCKRHVTKSKERAVLKAYGLPYPTPGAALDHRIPLCAGGSNAAENLWPEPKKPSLDKDKLERRLCGQLRQGTITQVEALRALGVSPSLAR